MSDKDFICELVRKAATILPKASKGFSTGWPQILTPKMRFTYTGSIADHKMADTALPTVLPTKTEIYAAMEYWYSDERVASTPESELQPKQIQVRCSPESKRGELRRSKSGDDIIVLAFLLKVSGSSEHNSHALDISLKVTF